MGAGPGAADGGLVVTPAGGRVMMGVTGERQRRSGPPSTAAGRRTHLTACGGHGPIPQQRECLHDHWEHREHSWARRLGSGAGLGRCAGDRRSAVLAVESLHATLAVDELLSAGEEGVTLGADFYLQHRYRGASVDDFAASAADGRWDVRRVNTGLHDLASVACVRTRVVRLIGYRKRIDRIRQGKKPAGTATGSWPAGNRRCSSFP